MDLTALRTPLTADDWKALGLDAMRVGAVTLVTGIPALGLPERADGLPVDWFAAPAPEGPPPAHRNTVTRIDHLVVRVPSLDDAIAALPFELRRVGGPRQWPMAFMAASSALPWASSTSF